MEEKDYPMFLVVDYSSLMPFNSITFKGCAECKIKPNKKLMLLKNKSEGMVLNEDQVKAIKFLLECMKEPKSNINPSDLIQLIDKLVEKQNNG